MNVRSLFWGLCVALMTSTAGFAQTAGYVVPKCTGDPVKDTPILRDAFARGGTIILPPCEYVVSGTFRLRSGTKLIGSGYYSSIIWSIMKRGDPVIDSDPNAALTDVYIGDINIKGPWGNGLVGVGDGLVLYGVTDSTFERLRIANFRGNAITIRKPAGQSVGLLRTRFDSIFVISPGTYAFDVDGSVDASWNMIDINSATTGAYRFRAGSTSSPPIGITGFIAEWHKSYSSKDHMILFDNPNGQAIRFDGCAASVFSAAAPGNLSFIKSSGTVKVDFIGCTGGGGDGTKFKNWILSPSRTVAYTPRINSSY